MITAYQEWLILAEENNRLHSLVYGGSWPTKVPLRSAHKPSTGSCFDDVCYCGIHALKERTFRRNDALYTSVIGTVALWGRVNIHANGYRAEFAYPLSVDGFICCALRCRNVAATSVVFAHVPQMLLGWCFEHGTNARPDTIAGFEQNTFSLPDTLQGVREAYGL